ncbi:PREDICTED: cytochrome P450 705A5 [Tarenaya hassleriana]|uniref:cytochrome P450 705A5 n=1 Tax=Tarenaya hassleriana TaxID=28532 RepID=UPI00053C6C90|nr:PREDICTED: cytochrome P450 705A5 [Tarenaya hassleriana]
MGKRCSGESGQAEQVRGLVSKSLDLGKKLVTANALRSLKKLGLSLFENETREISGMFDEILEKYLREHEENPNGDHKDMMDVLLEAYRTFYRRDRYFSAINAMDDGFNHPNIFKKLRQGIDSIVGTTRLIQETDLLNLPYLQAVVKEGLRLHPPLTLSPRRCGKLCKVSGYDVPDGNHQRLCDNERSGLMGGKGRRVPPREVLGTSERAGRWQRRRSEVLPFGSGRRACVGANLAYIFVGTAIDAMVQCFLIKIRIDGLKEIHSDCCDSNMIYKRT